MPVAEGADQCDVSPVRVLNCISFSCSEHLFPVGGSLVVCSLCLFVLGYFGLSPSGTGFCHLDLTAYLLVEIRL